MAVGQISLTASAITPYFLEYCPGDVGETAGGFRCPLPAEAIGQLGGLVSDAWPFWLSLDCNIRFNEDIFGTAIEAC